MKWFFWVPTLIVMAWWVLIHFAIAGVILVLILMTIPYAIIAKSMDIYD